MSGVVGDVSRPHPGDGSLGLLGAVTQERRVPRKVLLLPVLDLGATLTQATLERAVHRGIDSNLALQLTWRF